MHRDTLDARSGATPTWRDRAARALRAPLDAQVARGDAPRAAAVRCANESRDLKRRLEEHDDTEMHAEARRQTPSGSAGGTRRCSRSARSCARSSPRQKSIAADISRDLHMPAGVQGRRRRRHVTAQTRVCLRAVSAARRAIRARHFFGRGAGRAATHRCSTADARAQREAYAGGRWHVSLSRRSTRSRSISTRKRAAAAAHRRSARSGARRRPRKGVSSHIRGHVTEHTHGAGDTGRSTRARRRSRRRGPHRRVWSSGDRTIRT